MSNIYEHLLYSNITSINEDYYNESITRMEKFYENNINSLITFIIPSINRESLENTIRSLEEQKYEKWCGIIIFDNCYPSENIKKILDNDLRFLYISIKKRGCTYIDNENIKGFSGDVRNIGMSLIKTDWIAFIDDDDTISKDYLTIFLQEIKTDKLVDCIIFRMVLDNKIIPSSNLSIINN
jgi:glycosyltransferase involved in cell wall biosynthesis